MTTNPQSLYMTVQEYLEFDRSQLERRYEYVDGYVHLKSYSTLSHSMMGVNLGTILVKPIRQQGCQAFIADARVQLSPTRFVYPDAIVTCDERDRGEAEFARSPRVVFEILSPATEPYDRGPQAQMYRDCPSVEELLLIATSYQYVELFRRAGAFWHYLTFRPGDEVELASVAIRFSVDALYAATNVPRELEYKQPEK